jgi:hypothetical protein
VIGRIVNGNESRASGLAAISPAGRILKGNNETFISTQFELRENLFTFTV